MMMNKQKALAALRPGEEWAWSGDEYSGLTWLDSTSKPSEAEINAKYDELVAAEPMLELRRQRDAKLALTDWRASSDLILTEDWKNYRQALRDLPSTSPSPTFTDGVLGNVTWPTEP
jgi:hypothetical protein